MHVQLVETTELVEKAQSLVHVQTNLAKLGLASSDPAGNHQSGVEQQTRPSFKRAEPSSKQSWHV
jgi:hypothetical protein